MPRFDGEMKGAQLEEVSSTNPSPTARSRIYSNITDTAAAIPTFYNGTAWVPLKMRRQLTTSVSTTATLGLPTEILLCDATSAGFTVTLPTAASASGLTFIIKKDPADVSFNAVTIDGNGAELIDGSATILLNTIKEWVEIQSTGTAWRVLRSGFFTGKTAYTPAGSWTANSPTYTGFWWRVGSMINLDILIAFTGAPDNTSLTVNLPTGVTVDTTKLTSITAAVAPLLSQVTMYDDSATDVFLGWAYYSSTTAIVVKKDDGDGTASVLSQTAPFTWANLDRLHIKVTGIPAANWRGDS